MRLLFAVLLLGHWLVASDLHVIPDSSASTPPVYHKDTNWALFDSTVAAMRRADPDPPVVILAGDFLAHQFPNNVPLAERTMARIVRGFNRAFPRAQFVIVPGNNDDPCGDYRDTPGSPYFKYIAHLWAPLVNRNGVSPAFERDFGRYGWYDARLPIRGMRVLALDSVYWSVIYRPCRHEYPNAPQRELQWLSASLAGLPAGGRAIVVMHIPPGVDAHSTLLTHRLLVVPFLGDRVTAAIARDFSTSSPRIPWALAGHVHRDGFRLLGGVPMVIAPSISPVYDNNPAFLRLDVAADGTLRDYTPYVYDIDSETWSQAQSFDRTYGVGSFTAAALASVHGRLGTDVALRRRWSAAYVAGSYSRDIYAGTWRTYWCAQTEFGGAYTACAGLERRVEALPIAAGVVVAALIAALAFLSVRLARHRRAR